MPRNDDSDAALLRVVFAVSVTFITLAAVDLELVPHRFTRAPQRDSTRVRVTVAQHEAAPTPAGHLGDATSSHAIPHFREEEMLTATRWEPPARFNQQWIQAAVSDMLSPWRSAGVDHNFSAYLDDWATHQRKRHCWGVVHIRNLTATRSGCMGNGRYVRSTPDTSTRRRLTVEWHRYIVLLWSDTNLTLHIFTLVSSDFRWALDQLHSHSLNYSNGHDLFISKGSKPTPPLSPPPPTSKLF